MNNKFFIVTTVPRSLYFFSGQIQVLKQKFDMEVVSSGGNSLNDFGLKESIKVNPINMKRQISVFNDIVSLFRLYKLFANKKPFVVHGSTPKAGLLSMVAAWLAMVPVRIYYVHGLRYQGATGIKKLILMFMEKVSCFCATDIFAVSFGVKKELERSILINKFVNIINNGSVNGINTNYFDPFNKDIVDLEIFPKGSFIFGFIGRIVKDKGVNELVKSFIVVNKSYPNTKLLLVGDFEHELDSIKVKIKSEILNNKNIVHYNHQDDVRPFLKIINVFVFPSYREGFGMSLLEALAMNITPIATNILGCNELIENHKNGILVPKKSTRHLVDNMKMLYLDNTRLVQMSNIARKVAIDKYEQSVVWEKTVEAYSGIVSNKKAKNA
jgi:glycosyltransferase involved in cell wall biosynthesis